MRILILTNPEQSAFVKEVASFIGVDAKVFVRFGFGYIAPLEDYDVGVSYMYQKLVPARELAKADWINFHPAPLPEYKGRNLCYHAIMDEAEEFGASIHYMDETFDTGDIIKVRRFDICDWMTAGDVHELAMTTSEALFREYLPRIARGEKFTRSKNAGGVYHKKEPIDDLLYLSEKDERRIRAITCGDFVPKVEVNGVRYKIVRDE